MKACSSAKRLKAVLKHTHSTRFATSRAAGEGAKPLECVRFSGALRSWFARRYEVKAVLKRAQSIRFATPIAEARKKRFPTAHG